MKEEQLINQIRRVHTTESKIIPAKNSHFSSPFVPCPGIPCPPTPRLRPASRRLRLPPSGCQVQGALALSPTRMLQFPRDNRFSCLPRLLQHRCNPIPPPAPLKANLAIQICRTCIRLEKTSLSHLSRQISLCSFVKRVCKHRFSISVLGKFSQIHKHRF